MRIKKIYFILIGCLILCFTFLCVLNNINKNSLNIHFFNAGKADSCLITYKNNVVLIDTGYSNLDDEIIEYLNNKKIKKINYLIITHFDKDHVGSASSIIDRFDIDYVLQSNIPKESREYNKYIESLNKKGITPITVTNNYEFKLKKIKYRVNGPNKIYDKNESNNSSLIVSVCYKDNSFIFMGDAQKDRLKDFIKNNNDTYEFVKIPYHGNYQKQLEDLLDNIDAKYAIITSSSEDIEDDKMIELLDSMNIKYYLTRKGDIDIISDGNNIRINYSKNK